MTGRSKAAPAETFLVRALAVSLVIHLLCFGGWKLGEKQGWWRRDLMPKWLQSMRDRILTPMVKKLPASQKPKATPLLFVDVDPAVATAEPPKAPKFYGANNSVAATREKKADSDLPQIDGTQTKVLKTTDNAKPKAEPLRPTPPAPKEPQPKQEEVKDQPKETHAPGDLAFAKPAEKETVGAPEEKRRHPTVAQAREKLGMAGERMKHAGGGRVAMDSSLDVARTATGDYDWKLVQAVQACWDNLLLNRTITLAGKVVVEFRLHYDGSISNLKMDENETDDIQGQMCQTAIDKPKPYERWSPEMRREIGRDYRDIRFTFYYLH